MPENRWRSEAVPEKSPLNDPCCDWETALSPHALRHHPACRSSNTCCQASAESRRPPTRFRRVADCVLLLVFDVPHGDVFQRPDGLSRLKRKLELYVFTYLFICYIYLFIYVE